MNDLALIGPETLPDNLTAAEIDATMFVTGLTIGYGDLVTVRLITREIAVMIGLIGILLTGLVAAIGVRPPGQLLSMRQQDDGRVRMVD